MIERQSARPSAEDRRNPTFDAVIAGAGVAGLTAAALLARSGLKVLLLEKAAEPGGRARTSEQAGFLFNLGPRALYRTGHARRILTDLGVSYTAGRPAGRGEAVRGGGRFVLPAFFGSLVRTRLLGVADKIQFARFLGAIAKLDPAPIAGQTVHSWFQTLRLRPRVQQAVEAFLRLSTYVNAPDQLSAGAALAQLQLAVAGGVDYIDGGWQTLVDELRRVALAAGAQLVSHAKVDQVLESDGKVAGVVTADGTSYSSSAVIMACDPAAAAQMSRNTPAASALQKWQQQAIPVRAACLDVGLRHLPLPEPTFALGIDQPWYFSVHTAKARLAPPGGAVVHVLKYLPQPNSAETRDGKRDEQELAGVLDLLQPGWRTLLVRQQFLPSIEVTAALPSADRQGIAGRPGPAVPGMAGLYLVGDWVGPRGMLADAALASAEDAAIAVSKSWENHANCSPPTSRIAVAQ